MSEQRYPVGIQTFQNIIEEGYVYVDKTAYIKTLISKGKFIFLSRPRRFGKSLLLSTLEAYFEGRRELFKGLAADTMDLDWTPKPVLHFDFNAENYSLEKGLEYRLDGILRRYEKIYGRQTEDMTPSLRFSQLIEAAYRQTGQKVAILIDEYDKPLLDIEENTELYEKNQRILKSFYGNLKSMDRYICFVLITGVARFSKVSIFSDLNNLNDISMTNAFADICGWTEEELLSNFQPGIAELAEEREEDFQETVDELRRYYDGYLFADKGSRLYNPYSILKSLTNKEIEPYWFESGTPTFLARRIRNGRILPYDLNGQTCDKKRLLAVGLNDSNPIPLMFQTGYLTIADYDRDSKLYNLRFPNQEVETGFYEELLQVYVPVTNNPFTPFSFPLFKIDLTEGRPSDFMERLSTLLKKLPYEDHNESVYRAVTFLIAVLSGTVAQAEIHSYKGRSDLEVFTRKYIYVFEFKYNETVAAAMDQIHSRDYAGRHALDPRKLYLIAANFTENKDHRGLDYQIAEV